MHESLIKRIKRRIGIFLALRASLVGLTVWLFLWGTVVVVWRVSHRDIPSWLYAGAAALPVIVLLAACLVRRRLPSESVVRALVDRQSSCGGLLMAAQEHSLGAWQPRLPAPADLRVRWRAGRLVTAFLVAVVFVLVGFLAPQSMATWTETGLEIGNDVHKLTSTIDMLKEEKVLEQTRVDFLKDKLKQIQEQALGRDPKKSFDALDQVRDSLSRAAQKAAEEAVKKTETLSKAESLAGALQKNDGTLDGQLKKDALDELAGLLDKAAQDNALADMGLDADALKDLKAGEISPEDLKKLADNLKDAREDLAELVEKLANARLIDPAMLKDLDMPGELDPEEAAEIALARILGRRGGKGGVNEGPGHNPITWTEGSKEDGAKFKEQALPPGSLASFKDSIKVGVGKIQPKQADAVTSTGGAIQGAAAGGGEANANVVLPQHRAAVQRFFAGPKQ